MKLRSHILIQAPVFLGLLFLMDASAAAAVTSAHFIPSIDYLMLKANIGGGMHRKLFHNIFAAAVVGVGCYLALGWIVGILCALNILLHFALDLGGNGIAVLYPLSDHRLSV